MTSVARLAFADKRSDGFFDFSRYCTPVNGISLGNECAPTYTNGPPVRWVCFPSFPSCSILRVPCKYPVGIFAACVCNSYTAAFASFRRHNHSVSIKMRAPTSHDTASFNIYCRLNLCCIFYVLIQNGLQTKAICTARNIIWITMDIIIDVLWIYTY